MVDIEEVNTRQARLEAARELLHATFVGIDEVIDQLCDAISVWYLMPEVLSRPVIVNLWGMTGVGKTDLVRQLVKALQMQERFVEIELSNTDAEVPYSSVADRLSDAGILDGRPAILLVDEIQRFRTLTPSGDPVTQTRFSDFWELLSDGRLSRKVNPDLEWMIASMRGEDAQRARRTDEPAPDRIGLWRARNLQRTLGIPAALDGMDELSFGAAVAMLEQARADKRLHEPLDCTRHLIIVSGNLDEAFTMAGHTAEADVDADIFAAHTARVSMVDIKRALRRRFTPEQVARLGNVHVIYRSLTRADFTTLIEREIARLTDAALLNFAVSIQVTPAVRELVYRNGVFPVQGVRPVLSSVGDIVGTQVGQLLFHALAAGAEHAELDYDESAGELIGTVGSSVLRIPYAGRLDLIRNQASADQVACVAVHEAGHALAYGVLFGLAPLQVVVRAVGDGHEGFTHRHDTTHTRDSSLDLAVVALAGGLAEELVFGRGHASIGRAADRARATELVLDSVRRYGFSRWAMTYILEQDYATDSRVADPTAEDLMQQLVTRTEGLLVTHREALVELATDLAAQGSLTPDQVASVLGRHGIAISMRGERHTWTPSYAALLAAAARD